MGKAINMSLSVSSMNDALKEIEKYKNELILKTAVFVGRLADVGLETIDRHKYGGGAQGDSDFGGAQAYVRLGGRGMTATATLVFQGKDVAFIEFGAGVHYNGAGGSSPNPLGAPLGMVIGSYGKGLGLNDSWRYRDKIDGTWQVSHGTKAAMPMYHADQAIIDQFISIAKEVFGA